MAVRQKYQIQAATKKKEKTYFRQSAAKLKESTEEKARKKALKAQKRAIARAIKMHKALLAKKLRQAKSAKEKQKLKATMLPSYFVAQDISEKQFVGSKERMSLSKTIVLPSKYYTGLKNSKGNARSQTRFDSMVKSARIFLLRVISAFTRMKRQAELTISGKKALRHLEDLYNLMSLDSEDDEARMRLKLAYGEANYYVNRASQGYYQKHKGKGSEKYQDYFKRFIDAGPDKL